MEFAEEFFNLMHGLKIDEAAPKPTNSGPPPPPEPDGLDAFLQQVTLEAHLGNANSPASVTKAAANEWDEPLTKAYAGSGFAERSDARLATVFETIRKIFGPEHTAEADEACAIAERMRLEARGETILST